MTITSYAAAAEYLGTKDDRPLPGRSTRLQRRSEDRIAVRYQNTDVVTYRANGQIRLDSGGWRTLTTKVRIREYSPVVVASDRGVWSVAAPPDYFSGPTVPYTDGMTVGADGSLPSVDVRDSARQTAAARRLDRDVAQYIKGYAAHAVAHGLEAPGSGDCWGCYFHVEGAEPPRFNGFNGYTRPTPHGRVEPMGVNHYIDHIREAYYVPSLLWNALVAEGRPNPARVWQMIAADAARGSGQGVRRTLAWYFRRLKPALLAVVPLDLDEV